MLLFALKKNLFHVRGCICDFPQNKTRLERVVAQCAINVPTLSFIQSHHVVVVEVIVVVVIVIDVVVVANVVVVVIVAANVALGCLCLDAYSRLVL